MTYNGWTNWETWAVKLYQDNEEQSQRAVGALAKRCALIKLGRVKGKVFDWDRAIAAFQRCMRPAVRQVRAESDSAAILRINWREIVEVYIDDGIEEIEYQDRKEAAYHILDSSEE